MKWNGNFHKYQGTGNDFIIIDMMGGNDFKMEERTIRALCDRNFGPGADGVVLAMDSNCVEIKMRIINADGSEAEMCGNGIRCLAAFLKNEGRLKKESICIETAAGIKEVTVEDWNGFSGHVSVDMGMPDFVSSAIPVNTGEADFVEKEIAVEGKRYKATAVSMGNPHCVIFVEDMSLIEIEKEGSQIEHHDIFPKRANVEFAKAESFNEIEVKVWERGVGATMACGTGACAVAAAGFKTGRTDRRLKVKLPGGTLEIEIDDFGHIKMTGEAEKIYEGKISKGILEKVKF